MTTGAAIYLRLSRDDGRERTESDSIVSQRMLLQQFASKNGFSICAEYADDGLSGLQWNRPAFQEMLRAAERGLIGTVLVKDLSRLSRDYIRIGELLEYRFPMYGVRLIAVSDGVDTGTERASNEFSAVRALMNDWYTRDISRKVRVAVHARQQAGICTAATLPFGYQREGKIIIVKEPEAEVVRYIFRTYLAGSSFTAIAAGLTKQQIPSPRRSASGWSDATVRRILMNPAYTGRLLLHTTEKTGYKYGRTRRLPPDEAICYPVPAVISVEQFMQVQRRQTQRRHQKPHRHWLTGLVTCGECGRRMTVSGTAVRRLICTGRKTGNGCKNPSMRLDVLETDTAAALRAAGLPDSPALLPHLIDSVRISAEAAEIFLRCSKPVPPQLLSFPASAV